MHVSFRKSTALRLYSQNQSIKEVSLDQLNWSISDVGTMYGAILVERMRTHCGKLIGLADHRDRMLHGAKLLHIDCGYLADQFEFACHRIVNRNHDLIERQGDVGLAFLVSPGEIDSVVGNLFPAPTCMLHLVPLPTTKLTQWLTRGTELLLGESCTVPSVCWPTEIKTRSRLPYLLSDLQQDTLGGDKLSLLTTTRGTIADTSVANILIVDQSDRIVSPPLQDILVGCTLKVLTRLMMESGVELLYRDISPAELPLAKEVILTGTNGGVWHACQFENHRIGDGRPGPVVRRLQELWRSIGYEV